MSGRRKSLIKLIYHLSDDAVMRIYRLAEYLYVYREKGGTE